MAKKIFHVTAVDENGAVLERKCLRRAGLHSYLTTLPAGCEVGTRPVPETELDRKEYRAIRCKSSEMDYDSLQLNFDPMITRREAPKTGGWAVDGPRASLGRW